MIIRRALEEKLKLLASQFAAVSVTGLRQSGKTTLARTTFPAYLMFLCSCVLGAMDKF